MHIKERLRVYLKVVFCTSIFFLNSCIKDEDSNIPSSSLNLPFVSTTEVSSINQTTASCGGHIRKDGGTAITVRGFCWSTGRTPTIADYKTVDSAGIGGFSGSLKGLSPGTNYFVRAYATNKAGTGYGKVVSFTTQPEGRFTDYRDGNQYKTIIIGNQVWMAENLRYLPEVVAPQTGSAGLPFYYVQTYSGTNAADAKATTNYKIYGVLYNWHAAMQGATGSTSNPSGVNGICPCGWHLPSDAEWDELIDFLGGKFMAGSRLKAIKYWRYPNTGATNESGFSALPGGYRGAYNVNPGFYGLGVYGYWWSATDNDNNTAQCRSLFYYSYEVAQSSKNKGEGYSVRCVRDLESVNSTQ